MPACLIHYIKFLLVLEQLGAAGYTGISMKQMHFVNCAALAAVLFTSLTENLKLCFSAEVGIVLKLFLHFKQK